MDVSAEKSAVEELRQARLQEAIGTLAAGAAHNLNNLLTVISPVLEEIEPLVEEGNDPGVRDALLACSEARDLAGQLMEIARSDRSARRIRVSLRDLALEAVSLCRRASPPDVAFHPAFEDALWIVADPGAIRQVLLNLMVNARDAVSGRPEPAIWIRGWRDESNGIRLSVRDNGPGMSDTVAAQAFEPFFTTKGPYGTGLGLSSSLAMVLDNGGQLELRTSPDRGTTFELIFPLD